MHQYYIKDGTRQHGEGIGGTETWEKSFYNFLGHHTHFIDTVSLQQNEEAPLLI